jgi:hypothetical protein
MKASEAKAAAARIRDMRKKKAERDHKEWQQREKKRIAKERKERLEWWSEVGWADLQKRINKAVGEGKTHILREWIRLAMGGLPDEIVDRLRKDGFQVESGLEGGPTPCDPGCGDYFPFYKISWKHPTSETDNGQ